MKQSDTRQVKLPAISVRQPHAWSIMVAGKNVENRSWHTKLRGPMILHVSSYKPYAEEYREAEPQICELSDVDLPQVPDLPFGGICGAMWIDGMLRPTQMNDRWHQSACYGWQIGKVLPLPFHPFKGKAGIFYVDLTTTEILALKQAKWI